MKPSTAVRSVFALVMLPHLAIAQLPELSTVTRILRIPVIEVDSGAIHARAEFVGSEDYRLFSLVSAGELDTSYNRDDWSHWEDFDRDCQSTRHEILQQTSRVPVTFTRSTNCTVATGLWLDPFTGDTYMQASDLDIDHVIPLKYAHDHGGALWSMLVKKLFANDPENLLAVDDGQNQSKSARGPAEWLPPDTDYHCEYARKWQFVAAKYELELSAADSNKVLEIRNNCN